jgi:hypothetical protein
MDKRWHETLTRLLSRRGACGVILSGVLASLGFAAWDETAAKKKKKHKKKKKKCKAPNTKCGKRGCCTASQECRNGVCQGPCIFAKSPTTWILQRDCVAKSPIDIPDEVSLLDGDGHRIFLEGVPETLPYGLGAANGTVTIRNLTLDGAGLTSTCADRGVGIQYGSASGAIEDSTITGFSASCGDAVRLLVGGGATPAQSVDIDGVTFDDSLVGINTSGINHLTLNVTNCDMQRVKFGVQVQYNVSATIDSNDIAAETYGVVLATTDQVAAAPAVTATDNTITGALIGMSVAAVPGDTLTPTLTALHNTIVGPGPVANTTAGLQYNRRAAGSANDNTISNFIDSRGSAGCGIFVAADAGAVMIGADNTFPSPANEQNIC